MSILSILEGNNLYACLRSFVFNSAVYSFFIFLLACPSILSKPKIDIKKGITDEPNLWKTVISCSKLIGKNSFMWFLVCVFPFILYAFSQNNLFEQVSPITVFVIINGVLVLICILVWSTILLLYYEHSFSAMASGSWVITTSFITWVPQTELNLLFLTVAIIISACCSSFFLIHQKKKSQMRISNNVANRIN